YVVAGTQCLKLAASGRELRSFEVCSVYTMGGTIEALPGDRILVPEYRENRVVEYDADGKVRWEIKVDTPTSATRLPNGQTLVTTLRNQRVICFDREGR